jgi:hypothetical protein
MLVVGAFLPVALSWLLYIPCFAWIADVVRPYIIWPSTVGSYHVRSLPYLLGRVPTIGHALYISVFLLLNIVFTAVSYKSNQPNAWNPTVHSEIMSYVLGRTGIYAYIFLPLVFLFAGRNNFLLWITNWSHSTFLLLHRWIARIFTLQVLLHSIVSLAKYLQTGMYSMENTKPYWIWGIVATMCVVVLCFGSGLYVRNFYYGAFIITHVVLSVITVVGCWYHAYDLYKLLGGVCYWLYATAAVWSFDRLGRLLRIYNAGVCRTRVTELGEGYIRLDVPATRWQHKPGMHAYLYFPSLTPWTPWENHPFSVMPSVMLRPSLYHGRKTPGHLARSLNSSDSEAKNDDEKHASVSGRVNAGRRDRPDIGLTFFIRKGVGFTKSFQAHDNLLTLVEGPYPNNSSSAILRCDRVLLIGGGIGITALVAFMESHWNFKLCWSVKESGRRLVEELDDVLEHISDKEVRVGSRLDIHELLEQEVAEGWERLGVVVSGPPALCDDVRELVAREARQRTGMRFELEVEAYSW